jgi:hypothetical protein
MLELQNDKRQVVKMDYLIADLWQLQKYAPAFRSDRELLQELINLVDRVTTVREYGIISFKDGVILLRQSVNSENQAVAEWERFRRVSSYES